MSDGGGVRLQLLLVVVFAAGAAAVEAASANRVQHGVQRSTARPQLHLDGNDEKYAWTGGADDYRHGEWRTVTVTEVSRSSSRKRRSSRRRREGEPEARFVFRLRAYGRRFDLRVRTNRWPLLAPSVGVFRDSAGGGRLFPADEDVTAAATSCRHLVGRLGGSRGRSVVALTRCSGSDMNGYIRTPEEDYFLESVSGNVSGLHQHRLYRRPHSPADPHVGRWPEKREARRRRAHGALPEEGTLKTVELLVALDRHVIRRHGPTAATTLALTIFNMVSALYQDGLLGKPVRLVLVALLLLEHEQPGFHQDSYDARLLLDGFCQWQAALLDDSTDPDGNAVAASDALTGAAGRTQSTAAGGHRHDHAVLLTALDFCGWKNEPCDTLGFAPVRGMCEPRRSCSINKDTGLSAAYTVAHELGHNLGMQHDGDDGDCTSGRGTIMSPSLQAADGHVFWSDCSRKALLEFLGSDQSRCLDDRPTGKWQFLFPEVLPGRIYDAHEQCRLQFGPKSKSCPFAYAKSVCKELWCQVGSRRCESKFLPPAEGTGCGHSKWCRMGECVPEGEEGPLPVDGGWSSWTTWTACSRSCGGGVRQRNRKCDNPRSRFGGKYCLGQPTEHYLCNVQDCPPGGVDVRDAQCAAFDHKLFRGHFYRWTSYTREIAGVAKCRLYCKARGWEFVAALSEKVSDGASCTYREQDDGRSAWQPSGLTDTWSPPGSGDFSGRCVDGKCRRVGCDGRLDSRAVLDRCGVCGGNGTHCQDDGDSNSAVTLDHPADWPPTRTGGVVHAVGSRTSEAEELPCAGWRRCEANWETDEWGACAGCGPLDAEGLQKRRVRCSLRSTDGTVVRHDVARRRCERSNDGRHRPVRKRVCACPPRWHVGGWQQCTPQTGNCGVGLRTRRVTCRMPSRPGDTRQLQIAAEACSSAADGLAPAASVACRVPCVGRWQAMPWSECSSSCGGGWKVRRVSCLHPVSSNGGGVPVLACPAAAKPKTLLRCNLHMC